MRIISMVVLLVILLAGQAHANALWYVLEHGSKVDLATGSSINLTGRIALAGCGNEKTDPKATKLLYQFYAFQFDNLPEVLEPHVKESNSRIALFNGEGGVEVTEKPSMIAYRDGQMFSVDWMLHHQLEHDYGTEAEIFSRMLMLDPKQKSSLSFKSQQQSCPDTINLHLQIKEAWRTLKPHNRTSRTGEQRTATITSNHKEDVIGTVRIVATAIPNSEEKIDYREFKRLKLADGPYINSIPAALKNDRRSLSTPMPANAYRMPPTPSRSETAPQNKIKRAE